MGRQVLPGWAALGASAGIRSRGFRRARRPLKTPAFAGVGIAVLAASLVLVSSVAGATEPLVTATQTLAGLNDVAGGGYEPPDVQVAAGPGFVVQMVNLAERVWRTGGAPPQLLQTHGLASLFGSGRDRLTDPRVLYDASSGRWLASIADISKDSVLLAASTGADPTGPWTVATLPAAGCADQPRLGVADEIVVVAADVFDDCEDSGSAALGGAIWTVSKADLLAGSTSPAFSVFGPTAEYSSLAPVQSLSPTAAEYVVAVDPRFSRVVHLLEIRGVPPGEVEVAEVATPGIAALTRPPAASQPPSADGQRPPLSTNDQRVLDSVWENGRLWLSANSRCVPPGDAVIRTCARIVELATGTRTVSLDTDVAVAGAHVFFPALRPDGRGNLVIVAGESGVKVLPELIALARTADGVFTRPVVLAQSAGAYRGDRYGDYFAAARDPVDPAVVWVAGEAGTDVPSGRGWSTAVASVVVTPAGAMPPVVAGTAPPGVRALRTTARYGDAVELAYRQLDDGVGVSAVVTVRDAKKAVVFTTRTVRRTVHVEQRYTVLWHAKKLRGKFTYCVHSVSRTGIESPESCVPITLR